MAWKMRFTSFSERATKYILDPFPNGVELGAETLAVASYFVNFFFLGLGL